MSRKMWLIVIFVGFIIIIAKIREPKGDYHYEDAPCVQDNDCGNEFPTTVLVHD